MAATTVYLIRSNRTFAAVTGVLGISLTGDSKTYSTVTGTASNDTINVPGNTLADDDPARFQFIAGGAGLVIDTTYWVVNRAGDNFQLAASPGGSAIDFTSNITAAVLVSSVDDMMVWSSDFRDIFVGNGSLVVNNASSSVNIPTDSAFRATNPLTITPGAPGVVPTYANVSGGLSASDSDNVAHYPLRQTLLAKTHWRFDKGPSATPRFMYAEWLTGDIVSDYPPNLAPEN